ncbi:Crp/Fnr family transcriptional regulator [Cupriavidus basilensis]
MALRGGQLLCDAGQRVRHVYFPKDGVVSLLSLHADGSSVELAAVGSEGLVGLPALTGAGVHAAALRGQPTRHELAHRRRRPARAVSAAATHATAGHALHAAVPLTQVGQTAACICHRTLMEQLCRWILQTLDRIQSNELRITQQRIAEMLGVRREGVTEAMGKLQNLRLIEHTRGKIVVIDRNGLESMSGEAYTIVSAEVRRLVGDTRGDGALNRWLGRTVTD